MCLLWCDAPGSMRETGTLAAHQCVVSTVRGARTGRNIGVLDTRTLKASPTRLDHPQYRLHSIYFCGGSRRHSTFHQATRRTSSPPHTNDGKRLMQPPALPARTKSEKERKKHQTALITLQPPLQHCAFLSKAQHVILRHSRTAVKGRDLILTEEYQLFEVES